MKEIQDRFLYSKKDTTYLGWADQCFVGLYIGYPAFFSFLLLGFLFHFYREVNCMVVLIGSIPMGIFGILVHCAVFANKRYQKYFKQFEKENEQWHKKWKRRTIVFCIGSAVSLALGVGGMIGVLMLLDKNNAAVR